MNRSSLNLKSATSGAKPIRLQPGASEEMRRIALFSERPIQPMTASGKIINR